MNFLKNENIIDWLKPKRGQVINDRFLVGQHKKVCKSAQLIQYYSKFFKIIIDIMYLLQFHSIQLQSSST